MLEGKFHFSTVRVFCLAFGYGIHHVVVFMTMGASILIDAGIIYLLFILGDFPHIMRVHVAFNRCGIERVKVQSLVRPITKFVRIVIIPLTILYTIFTPSCPNSVSTFPMKAVPSAVKANTSKSVLVKLSGVVGVALVSAALLNTLKPIAFREEVSIFAISSSEQPINNVPKIAPSITVLFS